jgi:predicted ATP-binding protein involved in virulence
MKTSSRREKKHHHHRRTQKYGMPPEHEATYHGIHHWHKHMFEELGWMVLAKQYGYYDKINTYRNSVMRLKQAIEKRMSNVKDSDKKHDLAILHKDVLCLMAHIEKDF